jgi:thiamine kinase-like enzyme
VIALPGLTNIVHRVDDVIVRQGRPFAQELGVDREREASVLRQIRHLDLGPEMLSRDTALDRTLFRAIPGRALDAGGRTTALLGQSLQVLARLHGQRGTGRRFSAASLIRRYLDACKVDAGLRSTFEAQAEIAAALEANSDVRLCHNDCVAKNWIALPDGRVKLIDFEFAAPNDPAFDIATWCLSFEVAPTDPVLDAHYGPIAVDRVRAYFAVIDTLWCLYCRVLGARTSGPTQAVAEAQFEYRSSRVLRFTA